jgi:hypothetical protein
LGLAGTVRVNLSSVAFWQQKHCAVSRAPCALRTKCEHGPWAAVDLGPAGLRVLPVHYTLRHGGAGDAQPALRDWVLEVTARSLIDVARRLFG